jgi:alpha-L-fucosidase
MSMTRRTAVGILGTVAPVATLKRALGAPQPQQPAIQIAPGPFKATRQSLMEYQIPDWYCDAKFGIWAHWGPQSAPEMGDWYARQMYIQGQYDYHVKTYGHPSKFGY